MSSSRSLHGTKSERTAPLYESESSISAKSLTRVSCRRHLSMEFVAKHHKKKSSSSSRSSSKKDDDDRRPSLPDFSKDRAPSAPRRTTSFSSHNESEDGDSILSHAKAQSLKDEPPLTSKEAEERRWSASASSPSASSQGKTTKSKTTTSTNSSFVTDSSDDVSLTDSQIENIVIASIPEHIRNKMSDNLLKKLFTVDGSKEEGDQSIETSSLLADPLPDDISELSATIVSDQGIQANTRDKGDAAIKTTTIKKVKAKPAPLKQVDVPPKPARKSARSVVISDKIQVRHYERILEVHPSTSSGPSVGIGWKFEEETVKINWYKPPADPNAMLLSRSVREHMVLGELGYTNREMAKAVRQNLKLKNSRRRTVNNLQEYGSFAPVEKVEYLIEKCQRRLGRLKIGRRSGARTL
eukprot:scaffold22647_cov145-Cylindrotheca_fusiformis.AAC.3